MFLILLSISVTFIIYLSSFFFLIEAGSGLGSQGGLEAVRRGGRSQRVTDGFCKAGSVPEALAVVDRQAGMTLVFIGARG